jgi:ABC-2 type transport system permease protein
MYKSLVVARREYQAAVRTKAFLISLFLMPLLMGGGAIAQFLLQGQVDTREKRFAVVDRTDGERLVKALAAAAQTRNTEQIFDPETGEQIKPAFNIERVPPSDPAPAAMGQQRFELSERVRNDEIFGFLEIGSEVYDTNDTSVAAAAAAGPSAGSDGGASDAPHVRYQSNSPTYDDFRNWARPILEEAVQRERFKQSELDEAAVRAIIRPVPLVVKGLSEKDAATGAVQEAKDDNQAASILVPAALMILMFMLIMVGGTPAMQGVVEEKMQRIAEMVLGSIPPFELMMGKLLGLMGVSLTLAALYLGGAYWAANHFGFADLVSPRVMAWFIAYLVVAILMYGSLFIAVGAACSDIRDTQTMLWPVMLLAMLPLFVWINVAREPTSTFATAISFVPTATPMLMIIRLAVPPGIPWWQPALGLVLMLATTLACVYAAGRIFRVGILMQGKGASLRDLARWIVTG